MDFEINVIRPFNGVTLEIGGAVETYWKSMAMPLSVFPDRTPRPSLSSFSLSSAATSPSQSAVATGGHALTISSITGQYVYVTVQVTRDGHPVTFPRWQLPEDAFDIGVPNVTLAQFESFARRKGQWLNASMDIPMALADWRSAVAGCMSSLQLLMQVGGFYSCQVL